MKLDRKRLLFLTMLKYTQKYIHIIHLNKKSAYPRQEKRLPKPSLTDHHEKYGPVCSGRQWYGQRNEKINIYIRQIYGPIQMRFQKGTKDVFIKLLCQQEFWGSVKNSIKKHYDIMGSCAGVCDNFVYTAMFSFDGGIAVSSSFAFLESPVSPFFQQE